MAHFIDRPMAGALAESNQGHDDEGRPSDKESRHKKMDDVNQAVNGWPLRRNIDGEPPTVIFFHLGMKVWLNWDELSSHNLADDPFKEIGALLMVIYRLSW